MASGCKTLLTETKSGRKLYLKAYFEGRMSVEHVLQIEVAAVVQVLPAEVLDELKVVQTVCQWHGLFQANVCKWKTIQSATLIRHYSMRQIIWPMWQILQGLNQSRRSQLIMESKCQSCDLAFGDKSNCIHHLISQLGGGTVLVLFITVIRLTVNSRWLKSCKSFPNE